MKWHIPSPDEKKFAEQLLHTFLVPELEIIEKYVAGTATLDR